MLVTGLVVCQSAASVILFTYVDSRCYRGALSWPKCSVMFQGHKALRGDSAGKGCSECDRDRMIGVLMWAKLKALVVVGGVVTSVEWASLVSPAVAGAQLLRTATGPEITCLSGDVVEVQYARDSHDSNAYYVCATDTPPQRFRCPSEFLQNIYRRPPACYPRTIHFPP